MCAMTWRRSRWAMAMVCAWGLATGAVTAQTTIMVPALADTTIFSESNDLSNGGGDSLYAGHTNSTDDDRRGLIRFDLAGVIPAGSTITDVQLSMFLSRRKSGGEPVSIHLALSDWGEGASDSTVDGGGQGAPAIENDATWLYTFYDESNPGGSTTWMTPGGDFIATPSANVVVDSDGQFYTWGSTIEMIDDVQLWVDTPAENFGWFLIGNEAVKRTATRWTSKDSSDAQQHPVLMITFTAPAGSGACCFDDGSCTILTQSQCDAQSGFYQGDGAACLPNPCPQPFGACCFSDGSCMNLTQLDCETLSGIFQGAGTDCATTQCPVLTGACCFNDGSCNELTQAECAAQGGTFSGVGTDCSEADCPVVLEKYVDALPIPPLATPIGTTPEGYPHYQLDIVQTTQKIHRDLPDTTIWAYNGTWPGPTFLVQSGQPISIEFVNDLRDEFNNLRTDHFLDVDLCPHGAEDLPKVVTHLHGGHVPPDVDGYPEDTVLPGSSFTYVYPNDQRAGFIWYHDHALGITRLNVMMGMAGGYLIRDAEEAALNLPAGEFEVPLVIQDRTFESDGGFDYPSAWQDHFFGDTFVVNGKAWPFLEVKQGVYRLRVLNGCNSRALRLTFGNPPLPFDLIGVEGGLLESPVTLTEMTLGGAERADVLIDFSSLAPGTEIILNNSAGAPFPNGDPANDLPEVMKFVVLDQAGMAYNTPAQLSMIESLDPSHSFVTREFVLQKQAEACAGSEWLINGLHWDDITERPRLGSTETWRFVNPSGVMHPMHVHLVFFEVLERHQLLGFDMNNDPILGNALPILPTEEGWKDTVRVGPEEVVTIVARFEDYLGLYPYHCHILEHEDHEMMRQFEVVAVCIGDADGSGTVSFADVTAVLGNWLNDYTPGTGPGDANGDGVVNFGDVTTVLGNWLAVCP